ncbi:hypothetical protein [Alicyclobacillus sp. ALC3]|uniref:hypothetical protein n=1 Tax=Alicyclobacillus sp. ALC3 TaxID=2796143 RepID=UPI0023789703|nr:hypothetical protein [Alicyclobacillus sp. ALC3]WDL98302.1 hypothetical protein JC200_06330 [Alicyclobacillus sp. ALC3]
MRNGWRVSFTAANEAAETMVSLALAVSGLAPSLHSLHLVVLGEVVAACLLAWSGSADSFQSTAQRRGVLAGLTVALVALTALEAGGVAALLVGLAFVPTLIRRIRSITAVVESEVQGGRLAWDVGLLSIAWLYPVVVTPQGGLSGLYGWLTVLSLLTVVARLLAMHSAQMLAASLAVVHQSQRTVVTLLTLVTVVLGVFILTDIFPGLRFAFIVALVVALAAFAILTTWRALAAGFVVVLLLFGLSYLIRPLRTRGKGLNLSPGTPSQPTPHPPRVVHPAWMHLPWGWIGLGAALCLVVFVLLRMRFPGAQSQPDVQGIAVERERLVRRTRAAGGLPHTPMRRVVARWLRHRAKLHPVARGETLQSYVQRELAPHLSEVPDFAGSYDAERYGLKPQPHEEAARVEAALREAGLWRR